MPRIVINDAGLLAAAAGRLVIGPLDVTIAEAISSVEVLKVRD